MAIPEVALETNSKGAICGVNGGCSEANPPRDRGEGEGGEAEAGEVAKGVILSQAPAPVAAPVGGEASAGCVGVSGGVALGVPNLLQKGSSSPALAKVCISPAQAQAQAQTPALAQAQIRTKAQAQILALAQGQSQAETQVQSQAHRTRSLGRMDNAQGNA